MKKKRIGRGNSSKKGNTSCRGYKGQKSRSGFSKKKFFIGGQTPINILYPKYGFKKKKNNIFNKLNLKQKFLGIYINSEKFNKIINNFNLKKKSFFLNYNFSYNLMKKNLFLGSFIYNV
ncbi:hypothetical protein [Candidatus Vidania fulgoroideorum]